MEKGRKVEPMELQVSFIEKFAQENKVEADDSGLRCPDGRYFHQGDGLIGLFGADLGVIMAVRSVLSSKDLKPSTEELFSKYYDFIKVERGEDAKLFYHSDEEEHGPIGCGHVAKAASGKYEANYGISANDAQEIWDAAKQFEKVDYQVLLGGHKERAVLIIDSDKYSVNSQDENKQFMAFIVDRKRSDEWLNKTAVFFELDSEELKNAYWNQVETSSKILAHDLPQFKVDFNEEGKAKAEFVGVVEKLN